MASAAYDFLKLLKLPPEGESVNPEDPGCVAWLVPGSHSAQT